VSYQRIFEPLEARVLDGTPTTQLELLRFYTTLLRRWTSLLLSTDNVIPGWDVAIAACAKHVNKLCLTLTQTSSTASTHMDVLDYVDQILSTVTRLRQSIDLHLTIPPPAIIYILLFSPSLVVQSRLGGILARYKQLLEAAFTRSRQLTSEERQQIDSFNGFLMDACNCLWRGKAFTKTDANASGCNMSPQVVTALTNYLTSIDKDLQLTSAFGLSHSPTLCLQSASLLRSLEDAEIESTDGELHTRHAGPATQESLRQLALNGGLQLDWAEYRSGVLSHLEDSGTPGVPELLYNTLNHLRKRRTTKG
jgi:centromere protein I